MKNAIHMYQLLTAPFCNPVSRDMHVDVSRETMKSKLVTEVNDGR